MNECVHPSSISSLHGAFCGRSASTLQTRICKITPAGFYKSAFNSFIPAFLRQLEFSRAAVKSLCQFIDSSTFEVKHLINFEFAAQMKAAPKRKWHLCALRKCIAARGDIASESKIT
jgi:hypothetical protein